MLKNYFKIAWRNLSNNKVYSFINIFGLALGMAVAILIGLWIWDELSFDHYHKNHDRLAQVMLTQTFNGQTSTDQAIPIPLGDELRLKHSADFKNISLASWGDKLIMAAGDKKVSAQAMWVQPAFPSMLTLKMFEGNINALNDPSSVLLAQSTAISLFGDSDPINKTIRVGGKFEFKVAGVYEDLPVNTTLHNIHLLLPWEKYLTTDKSISRAAQQWDNTGSQLFVQLNKGIDFNRVSAEIENITRPHVKEGNGHLLLQPMDNWRLYGRFENGKVVGGRIQYEWLYGLIGIFVLLLACINFMNLSTAQSAKRAKEVGIRKAMGSLRAQLIGQFLSESLVMAGLAFLLSIGLVLLFMPYFNKMGSKEIVFPVTNLYFWGLAITFTAFTGLVSGSYPAFYLSGFNAVKVLKGTFRAGRFAALPRKVLVVAQFTISITLIIGTLIVFKQIQYAKNRPVGYTRAGLITVDMNTPDLYAHFDAIRNDLLQTGAIDNVAESTSPMTDVWNNDTGFSWQGKDPGMSPYFGIIAVTRDFGKTIGWHIEQGCDFSKDFATDSAAMILNESAVQLMGLKNPVGQLVKYGKKSYSVIGVINNLVMESPYTPVKPAVFLLNYGWGAGTINIKIKPSMPVREALTKIAPVFKQHNPGSPFEYKFTDDEYAQKFSDEERIGSLAVFFSVMAIFISSLGLFGLAAFVAERRTKEIGVRKVLGASVFNLWGMLSKDFILLVTLSCAISIPTAWYFLNNWLQHYNYHTDISWWIFIAASSGAIVITLLTVSGQAIKAAVANPVKSLRSE